MNTQVVKAQHLLAPPRTVAQWVRRVVIIALLALAGWTMSGMSAVRPAMASAEGWTAVSTVIRLVNTANGGVNVLLSPQLEGCTSQSGYGPHFASIYPDHPGINGLKTDLLVAMQTGAKVQLYLWEGCRVMETILFAK